MDPLLRWQIEASALDLQGRRLPLQGICSPALPPSRVHELPTSRRAGLRSSDPEGWAVWRVELGGRLRQALAWRDWMAAHPDASRQDAMALFQVEWNLFHRGLSLTRLPMVAQAAILDEAATGPIPSEWALHRIARMADPDAQVAAFEAVMRRLNAQALVAEQPQDEQRRRSARCGARATLEQALVWDGWRKDGKAATYEAIAALAEVSPFKVQRALRLLGGLALPLRQAVLALPEDDRRVTSVQLWDLSQLRDHAAQMRIFDERHPGLRAALAKQVA